MWRNNMSARVSCPTDALLCKTECESMREAELQVMDMLSVGSTCRVVQKQICSTSQVTHAKNSGSYFVHIYRQLYIET